MGMLFQDVRYGFRMLARNPGFTAVAVLSLALGIGLNTVMFSFVDQAGLRKLPVMEPERIVSISKTTYPTGFAYADRADFVDQCESLADLIAMSDEAAVTDYLELPRRLLASVVSRNYFTFLGLGPATGRFFSQADTPEVRAEPVVVISYRLWQRDFGGDPRLVGKPIELSGRTLTVVGVAPKGYSGTRSYAPEDCWVPAEVWHTKSPQWLTLRTVPVFRFWARLRPGATPESAQAQAAVIMERLAKTYRPDERVAQVKVSSILPTHGAGLYLQIVGVMALPLIVLAIACANVSGLLIARAVTRIKDTAIRAVLGGGRWRLIRQMLTENLLLSLIGGVLGFLVAAWAIRSLPALLPPSAMSPFPEFYVNWRLAGFAAGLSILATLIFGLLPAIRASRLELTSLLKADAGSRQAGGRRSALNLLVIGQLAASLVLLSVSGLFVRSLLHNLRAGPGFQLPDVLLVEVNPMEYGLPREQIRGYLRDVQERLSSLPGIRRVGVGALLSLDYGGSVHRSVVVADGSAGAGRTHAVGWNRIGGDFLSMLGSRVVRGRDFVRTDDSSGERVALINQNAAESLWPGEDPVGKWLRLDAADGDLCRVIGVVEDGPYCRHDGQARPYLFLPLTQSQTAEARLLLDTAGEPRAMIDPVRQVLRDVDERVRPVNIQTLHEYLRSSHAMFGRQFLAQMFGAFGVLGLILATVGLYAVIAYAVGSRTREIGIRVAVGANRRAILWMVLRRGLILTLIGEAVGLPIAIAVAQLFRSSLLGFHAADPVTFIGVPLILIAVSLIACLIPARRAARVDPLVALRHE